jgi:hypothetical protein
MLGLFARLSEGCRGFGFLRGHCNRASKNPNSHSGKDKITDPNFQTFVSWRFQDSANRLK